MYIDINCDDPCRYDLRCRYPKDGTPHNRLASLLSSGNERYRQTIAGIEEYRSFFDEIREVTPDPIEPCWNNLFFSSADAISLGYFLARSNPAHFLEVGSGYSTKFAFRTISRYKLDTKIISVDPSPRADIDNLCHQFHRSRLEESNLELFSCLKAGDVLLVDNSHRCLQNSDANVFFTEVLPAVDPGVLIGIHDVLLPWDYPDEWINRLYNEHYLLAIYLLFSNAYEIVLPVFFCKQLGYFDRFEDRASNFCTQMRMGGCCFWFKKL